MHRCHDAPLIPSDLMPWSFPPDLRASPCIIRVASCPHLFPLQSSCPIRRGLIGVTIFRLQCVVAVMLLLRRCRALLRYVVQMLYSVRNTWSYRSRVHAKLQRGKKIFVLSSYPVSTFHAMPAGFGAQYGHLGSWLWTVSTPAPLCHGYRRSGATRASAVPISRCKSCWSFIPVPVDHTGTFASRLWFHYGFGIHRCP